MRTYDQMNDKVWSTTKALGNLRCSKENLRSLLSGSERLQGVIAAHGSAFWSVIDWVEDPDYVITNAAFERQFGPIGAEPGEDVQEQSEQVHVAFLASTECESFNIVLGEAPSGIEALRRLVRRWDPLSGGKRRALLRQILVADRCKLQDFPAGLEKWEELVRRYERSKSSGTTTTALHDDIKTAAF